VFVEATRARAGPRIKVKRDELYLAGPEIHLEEFGIILFDKEV
jgi:hypothetical protein